jgi:hypothetical protein
LNERYDLIAIEKDSEDTDLSKYVIFSSDDLHLVTDYLEKNYISSTKILYVHDKRKDRIQGIIRTNKTN